MATQQHRPGQLQEPTEAGGAPWPLPLDRTAENALKHRPVHILLTLLLLFAPLARAKTSTQLPGSGLILDRWTTEDGLPLNHVIDVAVDPRGFVWLATLDGLVRFDGAHFRVYRRSELPELPSNRLVSVGFGADANPWVVTEEGDLVRLEGDQVKVWRRNAEGLGYGLLFRAEGQLWVRSMSGVVRLDTAPVSVQDPPDEPPHNVGSGPTLDLPIDFRVRRRTLAPDGSLWIATDGQGLLHARAPLVSTVGADQGVISTVLEDGAGQVWARGRWGELFRVEGDALIPWRAPDLSMERGLASMMAGPGGALWLATPMGVCALTGDTCAPVDPARWRLHGEDGRAMLSASDGRVWIGREDGVAVGERDGAGWRWRTMPQPEGAPVSATTHLVEAPDGAVWAATLGTGVIRYGRDGSQGWTMASGLSSDRIRALWISKEGVVWAGTEDAGLCRLTRAEDHARCLSTREGLFDDSIHSLQPDRQGRLWMSTNRGIFYVLLSELEAFFGGARPSVVSLGFDERDGMVNREANGAMAPAGATDRSGRVWFPTQAGLARIDPDRIPTPAPPVVILESVRVNGAPMALDGALVLSSDQRTLSLAWTSPEITWPEQLRFRYRLVGLDPDWRGLDTAREATWNSLPPGDLRFEVQACLGGTWGPVAALTLDRQPAFTETRAFPLSLVLGGLAVGVLALVGQRVRARRREEELEALIFARTSDLARTNRALTEQSARLAEVDALRKRLIADLSHELRTPLTLITGPLEELAASGGVPPGPGRETLSVALHNTARLEALVDQLLDLARLESGKILLRVRRRDLSGFIRRVGTRFEPECARRRLTLRFDLPESGAELYFDADLLDKVLSNLLGNALKFTPDGGEITARLEIPGDDGPARVEVNDTGIGVPIALRGRLFERFVQGESGDTRRFEGVGIGLALAHDLVALHGGEIGVEAQPEGPGSRFWFTLPRGVDHLAPEDLQLGDDPSSPVTPLPPLAPPEPGPDEGERPRVLVVEDHAELRDFLVAHLRRFFSVRAAASGPEALALATADPPAVIVSDVMMPGMDGLELCRQVRAQPALRAVPILLASAKVTEDDRVAGLELADDYLSKPLRMRELVARIQRWVARGTPTGPAPADPSGPPDAREGLGQVDRDQIAKIEATVAARLADPNFGVEEMARALAFSRRQLLREVQRLTGQSPSDLLRARRMEEGRRLLETGAVSTVSEAADRVGLSLAYFSRTYSAWFGANPSEALRRTRD